MANTPTAYRHFRLNLEQQRKRAKELLSSARSGDTSALTRIGISARTDPNAPEIKLADAQRAIASELRFES